MIGYCSNCKTKKTIENITLKKMANGVYMYLGTCITCQTQIGKTKK